MKLYLAMLCESVCVCEWVSVCLAIKKPIFGAKLMFIAMHDDDDAGDDDDADADDE